MASLRVCSGTQHSLTQAGEEAVGAVASTMLHGYD